MLCSVGYCAQLICVRFNDFHLDFFFALPGTGLKMRVYSDRCSVGASLFQFPKSSLENVINSRAYRTYVGPGSIILIIFEECVFFYNGRRRSSTKTSHRYAFNFLSLNVINKAPPPPFTTHTITTIIS